MSSGVVGFFAHTLKGRDIHSDPVDLQQKGQCPLPRAGQGNPQRANLQGMDPRPWGLGVEEGVLSGATGSWEDWVLRG